MEDMGLLLGVGFPLGRIGGSPLDRFINREARVLYLAMSLSGALRWTFDVCGGGDGGGLCCVRCQREMNMSIFLGEYPKYVTICPVYNGYSRYMVVQI